MRSFIAATIASLAVAEPMLYKAKNDGWASLNITEDGVAKTVYIAAPFWFTGEGGDHLTIPEGGRVYLSNTPDLEA